MKREEIIKEFDKAGINFDINTDLPYGSADYIDDSFSRVLDLVEKLVSKNKSLHLVSKSFTPKQIVELLKEEETLDDAISFFTHQSNVC